MMERLVFHVDVNSAFLSWSSAQRLKDDPEAEDLRLIPSVVGGDPEKRTGVVLAKSVPARKFGVRTGEPLAQAFRKCPDLVVIPPDFRIYKRASAAMMEMLAEYAPVVEKFSIDEAFLDMSGTNKLYPDPITLAYDIKDRIHRELGFTVNIGISQNKLLAKMASDFEKPDKVHTLFRNEIREKMWNLPVGDLLYVGYHSVEKLKRMDIQTIGQLACTPEAVLKSVFGMKQAHQMHNYANGIDDSPVGEGEVANKGYGNSVTLPYDLKQASEVYPVLLALADSVGSRLRADHMMASSISVSLKDNTFHTISHQATLPESTDITDVIYEMSVELFDQLWDCKTPIRLLGISAGKAEEAGYYQYTLFDEQKRQKVRSLDRMVDTIRNRYGDGALKRGTLLDAAQTERVGRKHRRENPEEVMKNRKKEKQQDETAGNREAAETHETEE
ncbi:MAG: DNA polymerase IV [Lachnospiraceae bacterium]|nr:DNA polymerase IV [Lachnospiraceae bacterium]